MHRDRRESGECLCRRRADHLPRHQNRKSGPILIGRSLQRRRAVVDPERADHRRCPLFMGYEVRDVRQRAVGHRRDRADIATLRDVRVPHAVPLEPGEVSFTETAARRHAYEEPNLAQGDKAVARSASVPSRRGSRFGPHTAHTRTAIVDGASPSPLRELVAVAPLSWHHVASGTLNVRPSTVI